MGGVAKINGLKLRNSKRNLNNSIMIGDMVSIVNSRITFKGNNNAVVIGDSVLMRNVNIVFEDDGNTIKIGTRTKLCGDAELCAIEGTKIIIGSDCLFSSNLHFRTGDSHSILDKNGKRINPAEDIVIGNHVWIGTKVTCLKGTRVSDDSVIAATATLTRKYNENNVIIGGVPGSIIKRGINWDYSR